MNGKRLGRNQSWPNRSSIPAFAWGRDENYENSLSGWAMLSEIQTKHPQAKKSATLPLIHQSVIWSIIQKMNLKEISMKL